MTTDKKIDELFRLLTITLRKTTRSLQLSRELSIEIKYLPEADKGEVNRIGRDIKEEISEIKDLQDAISKAREM